MLELSSLKVIKIDRNRHVSWAVETWNTGIGEIAKIFLENLKQMSGVTFESVPKLAQKIGCNEVLGV